MAKISVPLLTNFGYDSNSNPYTGAIPGTDISAHFGKFPMMYNCAAYAREDMPTSITQRPAYISTTYTGSTYINSMHIPLPTGAFGITTQDIFVVATNAGTGIAALYKNGVHIQDLTAIVTSGAYRKIWWTSDENYVVVGGDIAGTYYYNRGTGVVTRITSANYPGSRGFVVLDQTFFTSTLNGKIYNSSVGDPSTWAATDYISAELAPDQLQTIVKHHNHIVAIGLTSTEFFYDAGNPVGSILQRRQDVSYKIGCLEYDSVASFNDLVFFVGTSEGGTYVSGTPPYFPAVYIIDNFNIKKISNSAVEQFLSRAIVGYRGWVVSLGGKLYYILSSPDAQGGYIGNFSLIYDVALDHWSIWDFSVSAASGDFFIIEDPNNVKNAYICRFSIQDYQDTFNSVSTNIHSYIVTNPMVGEPGSEQLRKYLRDLYITSRGVNAAQNITVYWSDDNYYTFNSGVTLDIGNRRKINRAGSFRDRAFKIDYAGGARLNLTTIGFELIYGDN